MDHIYTHIYFTHISYMTLEVNNDIIYPNDPKRYCSHNPKPWLYFQEILAILFSQNHGYIIKKTTKTNCVFLFFITCDGFRTISSNLTASQEKQSWEKKLQNIRREKPVNGW